MENEETVVQDEAWLPEEENGCQTESAKMINQQQTLEQTETENSEEIKIASISAGNEARRDFDNELEHLLKAYPNALEKGGLPEEVRREAAKGKNVSLAYAEFRLKQLESENRQLRQNAKNSAAAPVKGTGGFTAGADEFTKGFDSEY